MGREFSQLKQQQPHCLYVYITFCAACSARIRSFDPKMSPKLGCLRHCKLLLVLNQHIYVCV